jgi:hypothetical protein
LFSDFLGFCNILLGLFPFIGFIPSFWANPDLWDISCLGFALLFVGSVSVVWFNKSIIILLWFGIFHFLLFIKREFPDQVAMFVASSASEGDLFILDVLDPFLILEFEAYCFWECSRHIHLYAYSCVRCVSPFQGGFYGLYVFPQFIPYFF